MKFDSTLKNNYLNLSEQRKRLLITAKDELKDLKEKMFDNYGIEDIFLLELFYDNDVPFIDKIPILFEMNYKDFCSLVDSKSINYPSLEIFIKSDDETYSFNKDNLKILKEDFHYDKIYKL